MEGTGNMWTERRNRDAAVMYQNTVEKLFWQLQSGSQKKGMFLFPPTD